MRPIDADALIDNMVDYVADGYADSRIDFESYTKMVQTAPTIDAVEVVHGEWMAKNSHTMYCSVCGFEEVAWRTQDYGYCPNCGAKMDGERGE